MWSDLQKCIKFVGSLYGHSIPKIGVSALKMLSRFVPWGFIRPGRGICLKFEVASDANENNENRKKGLKKRCF